MEVPWKGHDFFTNVEQIKPHDQRGLDLHGERQVMIDKSLLTIFIHLPYHLATVTMFTFSGFAMFHQGRC